MSESVATKRAREAFQEAIDHTWEAFKEAIDHAKKAYHEALAGAGVKITEETNEAKEG